MTQRFSMTPRTLRTVSILSGLLLAAVALIGWSQSWFVVTLTGSFDGHPALEVGGDVGAPAVAALALAGAAGLAAMAISGPFFRTVLAVLQVVVGASVALSAALAFAAPVSAVGPAVTEATGLEGNETVAPLIGELSTTVWPYLVLIAGVLLAILGIGILITGRAWPGLGRRYEPVRFEPTNTAEASEGDAAVSSWDELSGGSDPTSG